MRVLLLLLLAAAAGFYFWLGSSNKEVTLPIQIPEILIPSTPAPFLFQEITIPYLRGRDYQSTLGPMQEYQDSSTYTSYLTSYDSDGLKINGLITIPKEEGPHPAIVFVHGYIAPTTYRTTEKYVDYVNYLARNGFVVFKIDLRGHGDSQGDPGGSYYSGDYIVDTLNAYSALQNADFVDPKKIGLWGHSMAGNVLSRVIAVKKDIPAAVIWAGAGYTYSDLAEYRLMDRSYRPPSTDTERLRKRQLLNDSYGTFNADSWFWKLVPATNYLDGVKTAIEIHHAADDDVVSVEYSRNLMKVLDPTNIPHSLFEYQTGGHNITGSSFTQAMQRTVEFFKENL
jgi:dipeptidyl aminopeptidase/acylaminoacyl peptidase